VLQRALHRGWIRLDAGAVLGNFRIPSDGELSRPRRRLSRELAFLDGDSYAGEDEHFNADPVANLDGCRFRVGDTDPNRDVKREQYSATHANFNPGRHQFVDHDANFDTKRHQFSNANPNVNARSD
jgi:hypothetical protein